MDWGTTWHRPASHPGQGSAAKLKLWVRSGCPVRLFSLQLACRPSMGCGYLGTPRGRSGVWAPGSVICVCKAHCVHVGGLAVFGTSAALCSLPTPLTTVYLRAFLALKDTWVSAVTPHLQPPRLSPSILPSQWSGLLWGFPTTREPLRVWQFSLSI